MASVGHVHASAARDAARPTSWSSSAPRRRPAEAIAATVREYAAAGDHVAVNTDEEDADLERFVGFLAGEVNPLLK